jgi:hypothetical protein
MSDNLIEAAATRLFADLATSEVVNAAEAGSWPEALWQAVEAAGFLDALTADRGPAALDGLGDAAAILAAAARHAAPLPLAETLLARWLLKGAGLAVPDGPLSLAVDGFELRRTGSGWQITGGASAIPWARWAGVVVVLAGNAVVRLDPARGTLHPHTSLAGEPRDALMVDALLPLADAAPAPAGVDAACLRSLGAVCRAVQMAGALDEVLALSVRYANDRVQFGRPLAKFQAIQQQLALLAEAVAASAVAAAAAVEALAQGAPEPEAWCAVAAAKIRVGEAAGKAAEIAHQVHGAMGFTHEHRLHHLTRRLWSWRDEFGHEVEWATALGHRVAAAGADGLWPLLTQS